MKLLTLNCQRGYQPGLESFLKELLEQNTYDFLLLQEVDNKVLEFLKHTSYKSVRAYCKEAEQDSELCIVYRSSFNVTETGYQSFAGMRNDPWRGHKHPSFGLLWGKFEVEGMPWIMSSIHLHSGIDRKARTAELTLIKKMLLEHSPILTIFSGDSNAGFPGESASMARLLAPEFSWVSKNIGPTLDSRYSENVPHLPNRIAAFLSLFNIKIPLWTDQVFASRKVVERYTVTCRVLSDRVSDHSPVEFVLEELYQNDN